jgi:regulator of replication initiation timing
MTGTGLTPIEGYGGATISPTPLILTQSVTPSLGSFEDVGGATAFFYNSLSNIFASGFDIMKTQYLIEKDAEDGDLDPSDFMLQAEIGEEHGVESLRIELEKERQRLNRAIQEAARREEEEGVDIYRSLGLQ